jgi:hypothetical protein
LSGCFRAAALSAPFKKSLLNLLRDGGSAIPIFLTTMAARNVVGDSGSDRFTIGTAEVRAIDPLNSRLLLVHRIVAITVD